MALATPTKTRCLIKAAMVTAAGKSPVYGDFETPIAKPDQELIRVRAAALSNFTRSTAGGSHYSSESIFPAIAGADGVGTTQDGRRVYFAMPEKPFGALAELCPVESRRCIALPDSLDDILAAAIANPGMAAWTAMEVRAQFKAGETVLINGASGTAGRLAVQLAKYLGAKKIIATGRSADELEEVRQLGADVVVPFTLDILHPSGAKDYESALTEACADGIDVALDFLWGESAQTVIAAIAKSAEEAKPVRFVHTGGASGEKNIELAGAALRSSALTLMGSGIGSVRPSTLLKSIQCVFEAVQPAGLTIATKVVALSEIEQVWEHAAGKPRLVFSIG